MQTVHLCTHGLPGLQICQFVNESTQGFSIADAGTEEMWIDMDGTPCISLLHWTREQVNYRTTMHT